MDIRSTIADQASRTLPVAPVVGMTLWGISLADWVYVLSALYLIMQMGWLGYKAYRHFKHKEDA